MTARSLAGRVSAFAHLAGFGAARPQPKAEEGDTPPADGTTTEEVEEQVEETQEQVDDHEERISNLEEQAGTDTEGEDPDAEPEEPAARAAWQSGRRAGARAERARGAAIFGADEAAGNPALAAHLAFETTQSAQQAVGTLRASTVAGAPAPKANRKGLDQRMQAQPQPRLGADGGRPAAEGSTQSLIDRMTAAARAAGVAPALKR